MKSTRLVPPITAERAPLMLLREEVRSFIADQIAAGLITPSVDSWLTGWDERFTRALADRGWLGVTVPAEYGGHDRTFLERFVVTEELLAADAPVAAHWIADRQIVPSLLKCPVLAQIWNRGTETLFFLQSFGVSAFSESACPNLTPVRIELVKFSV